MMTASKVCPNMSVDNFNIELARNICQRVEKVISDVLSRRNDHGLNKYKETDSQDCYPLKGEEKGMKLCTRIVVDEARIQGMDQFFEESFLNNMFALYSHVCRHFQYFRTIFS